MAATYQMLTMTTILSKDKETEVKFNDVVGLVVTPRTSSRSGNTSFEISQRWGEFYLYKITQHNSDSYYPNDSNKFRIKHDVNLKFYVIQGQSYSLTLSPIICISKIPSTTAPKRTRIDENMKFELTPVPLDYKGERYRFEVTKKEGDFKIVLIEKTNTELSTVPFNHEVGAFELDKTALNAVIMFYIMMKPTYIVLESIPQPKLTLNDLNFEMVTATAMLLSNGESKVHFSDKIEFTVEPTNTDENGWTEFVIIKSKGDFVIYKIHKDDGFHIPFYPEDNTFISHVDEIHHFYIIAGNGISPSSIACLDLGNEVSILDDTIPYEFDDTKQLDVLLTRRALESYRFRLANYKGSFKVLTVDHGFWFPKEVIFDEGKKSFEIQKDGDEVYFRIYIAFLKDD